MSTLDEQYQYFHQQQLLFDPHAFSLDQYGAIREKTPTESLVNHSGLSPGPLTATPPLSRNTSRPPEQLPRDQPAPDHMLWDEGSLSNSPTSVRTPDGESFEVEMLDTDMHTFYHQNAAGMTTQASHSAIPAVDPSMFFAPNGTISNHGMFLQELLLTRADTYSCKHCSPPDTGGSRPAVPAPVSASNPTCKPLSSSTDSAQCFRTELHSPAGST